MEEKYEIDAKIRQNGNQVVYRVFSKDQIPYSLTRVSIESEDLERFHDPRVLRFCLKSLLEFSHECVRPILEAGFNKEGHYLWVVSHWFEGELVTEQTLAPGDLDSLQAQLEQTIADLGDHAVFLSFDADELLTTRTADGFLHVLCKINYGRWFQEYGEDCSGKKKVAQDQLKRLFAFLKQKDCPLVLEESPEKKGRSLTIQKKGKNHPEPRADNDWMGRVISVLLLLTCLAGIVWFTLLGEEKANQIEKLERVLKEKGSEE